MRKKESHPMCNDRAGAPRLVSKATLDEATGTLTLRLATEEEIAENNRLLEAKKRTVSRER